MMDSTQEIAKLYAALDEITARRYSFTDDAYQQVIQALQDKIRRLQIESPAPDQDEIRLVTIMFIDIVNSTRMTLSLSAEDWKATVGTAHNHVAGLIHEFGGIVGQYLGDGLLCFFGSTISRDDDALRAVRCALEVQTVIARYSEEIYVKHDLEFNVRIGISTGRAVVGMFGSAENRTMLALGMPTNLAARLQSVAGPGETLIDAQTYRLVSRHFVTVAYPAQTIRGFEAPVQYYAVKAPRDHRLTHLTTSNIATFETDFVGREAVIQQIKDDLRHSLDNKRWSVITVYGETGLGKSRLLQAILDSSATTAFETFVIVGSYQRRSSAYSLIQDLLATRCQLREDMSASEIQQRIVAYIQQTSQQPDPEATAHAMGFLAGYGFVNSPHVRLLQKGGAEQAQMASAIVTNWFREQAEAQPLLLVVDNLHWLDASSLRLLEHLATDLKDMAGSILAAARPTLHDHAEEYMQSVSNHVEIELPRLDDKTIDQIINAVFEQVDDVPDSLPELIRDRAEGNPLFVEEFLYMLLDNGIIEHNDTGRWQINRFQFSMRSSVLPDGLLALLQARLDELSPAARQVIQFAATVGTSFWPGAMAGLLDQAEIQAALADLEARRMIVPEADSDFENETAYRFRHTLYRAVIYSTLTRQNRVLYHRHTASWLAGRVADQPEILGTLAEHYLKGDQDEESLKTYCQAAQDRFERGFMGETLGLIEKGLNAAREVPRESALPNVSFLWVLQAKTLNALDRYEEASAASESALRLMAELPDLSILDQKASAARTLGHAHLSMGRYTEAFDALNLANSLLPKDNDSGQAAVLRTFGQLFQARGQLNESLAYQQQAYTIAAANGDEREISRIMSRLSIIAMERGEFTSALAYAEQVLERNRQDGNTYYQSLDLGQLARIHYTLFAYNEALALCDEAQSLQAHIRYRDPRLQSTRALCLLSTGQREAGLALLHELATNESQNIETRQRVQLAMIAGLLMVGDHQKCYQQASEVLKSVGDYSVLLYGRSLMWQGIAMKALENPEASATLHNALNHELVYGGRYAWLCYYALGTASETPEKGQEWFQQSLDTLQAIANSLYSRPKLQATLLNSERLRWLKAETDKAKT